MKEILDQLTQHAIIPVIAIDAPDSAIPLADALINGRLPVAEITFRTPAAAKVMKAIADERPDVIVGAGTVLTVQNLEAAHAAGARFGVAPGTNPAVVRRAKELGMPFIPGVATPTDIELALSLGCRLLKLFPAGALGGPSMVHALAGPYSHTGIRFVPTGGVKPGNLVDYLMHDEVAAVGGTWIATKNDIGARAWRTISARCREAAIIRDEARRQ
jgi:2-dehydro-3-deoxyphosphogluconate aldolase/(4S)-4-hydroxy-2-oxoglutarate aldolase